MIGLYERTSNTTFLGSWSNICQGQQASTVENNLHLSVEDWWERGLPENRSYKWGIGSSYAVHINNGLVDQNYQYSTYKAIVTARPADHQRDVVECVDSLESKETQAGRVWELPNTTYCKRLKKDNIKNVTTNDHNLLRHNWSRRRIRLLVRISWDQPFGCKFYKMTRC